METAKLMQQLEGLLPAIRAKRDEIERDRRLPRDLVNMLRDTGVFALELPRARRRRSQPGGHPARDRDRISGPRLDGLVRIFQIGAPTGNAGPLYRLPPVGWFVAHVAAVSLGIARAALDELIALARTKTPTFSTAVLADRPAAQLELARALGRTPTAPMF